MRNADANRAATTNGVSGTPWWKGAVIYQVYPRSFQDSDGNGIGDLPGITSRLGYIRDLGVDGIWVSPFYRSPQDDFGYDVADHCDVDPIFGTLEDFDQLIARAHELELKVIVDQVYSHTSDRHTWFEQSRSGREGEMSDWYIWADARNDGSPPNNWLSVFGGPAWTWDARRRQYYMHNYLASQPDLNLHNPAVQDALLDIARFWLDRGVDGMRLDAINYGMHDPDLTDNPPASPSMRSDARPWLMQRKRYNTNHPAMPAFLERLSSTAADYGDILTVAEVGGDDALSTMHAYTQGDDRLSTAYGFDFLSCRGSVAGKVHEVMTAWPDEPGAGWPSWAFSNHDAPRVVSRWETAQSPAERAQLYMLLLMCLRGSVFVYQGEELGLPQAEIPFEQLRDPEGIANWPLSLGRDGARTPMPWEAELTHAGFSSNDPWLPAPEEHRALAADRQMAQEDSVLNSSKRLIALRNTFPALRTGSIRFLDAPHHLLAFIREAGDTRLLCVFNLGEQDVEWHAPVDVVENVEQLGAASPDGKFTSYSAHVSLIR